MRCLKLIIDEAMGFSISLPEASFANGIPQENIFNKKTLSFVFEWKKINSRSTQCILGTSPSQNSEKKSSSWNNRSSRLKEWNMMCSIRYASFKTRLESKWSEKRFITSSQASLMINIAKIVKYINTILK